MTIYLHEKFRRQIQDTRIPRDVLKGVLKRFQEMSRIESAEAFSEYLGRKGVDWRRFQGSRLGKLKLSAGDRLVCAWAEDLRWDKPEAFVLLAWEAHDDQERFGFDGGVTDRDCVPLSDVLSGFYELGLLPSEDMPEEGEDVDPEDAADVMQMVWDIHSSAYLRTDEELLRDDAREVHLSAHQLECIDIFQARKLPMLLLGSAGSGKTLVAVHILNDLPATPAVYLTQSNELLHYSKGMYDELVRDRGGPGDKQVSFLNINDLCMERLGMREERFVRGKGFQRFLEQSGTWKARRPGAPLPMAVWREVRGVIKGYMGVDWNRNAPLSQEGFPRLDRLFRDGWLKRCGTGKFSREFTLADSAMETRRRLEAALERSAQPDAGRGGAFGRGGTGGGGKNGAGGGGGKSGTGGGTSGTSGKSGMVGKGGKGGPSDGETLTEQDAAAMERILRYFERFSNVPPLLPRDEYLRLKEEDTALEQEHREFIYTIAEEYEAYLRREGLFDENDLARTLLERDWDTLPAYDLVVVDEVQDYTEMQILLIHRLSRNRRLLLFTGDEHQTIHPTVFSPGHMGKLYYGEYALQKQLLTTNYRCRQCILDKVNIVSALRRDCTGRRDSDVEQPDVSINPGGGMTYRLRYDEDTVPQLLLTMANYPDAAILVPDEDVKRTVEDLIREEQARQEAEAAEEAEESDGDGDRRRRGRRPKKEKSERRRRTAHRYVFTAAEIKGVEYDFVLCFNMIGANHEELHRILTEGKRRSTGNRYYFNLLYVAMTRARQYLGFVDWNIVPELEEALALSDVSYAQANSRLTSLGSEDRDWLAKAAELERAGLYMEALDYYREGHAAPDDEYRCLARHAEYEAEPRDPLEAAKYYLLVQDWESMERSAARVERRNNNPFRLITCAARPGDLGLKQSYEAGQMEKMIAQTYGRAKERRAAARIMKDRLAGQIQRDCAGLLDLAAQFRRAREGEK